MVQLADSEWELPPDQRQAGLPPGDTPAVQPLTQFRSVLFPAGVRPPTAATTEPGYFHDLNLDQICATVLASRSELALESHFYRALHDLATIEHRQALMRDLDVAPSLTAVAGFVTRMAEVHTRRSYVRKLSCVYQRQWWWHAMLCAYAEAVCDFAEELCPLELRCAGLLALREYVLAYRDSPGFRELQQDNATVAQALASVRYTVFVRGLTVSVDSYHGQEDLAARVTDTFARFRTADAPSHEAKLSEYLAMNPVEERVLALVAALHPDQFGQLASYCARHEQALDKRLLRFDREIQLLLAYREYIAPVQAAGLPFCYPTLSATAHEESVSDAFDLALAHKLAASQAQVITNDYALADGESALVITGPNQGGKTTFARMFGQLHHLAALGLPVPGSSATLRLPDRIFTHFPRVEDPRSGHSRFEQEVAEVGATLQQASEESLVIFNETFSSTATLDAAQVGGRVLGALLARGALCLYVTFIDELAAHNDQVVSMMSIVNPDDPTVRTYKVVRKPADGHAHAVALARHYGLGHDQVKVRLAR